MRIAEVFGKSKSISVKSTAKETVITVDRKSRFIMKDAKALLDKLNQAGVDLKKEQISLKVTGQICSKSSAFLIEKGIRVK